MDAGMWLAVDLTRLADYFKRAIAQENQGIVKAVRIFRLSDMKKRRAAREAGRALTRWVFEAALTPALFEAGEVADTLEGRFDAAALHGALVMRAMQQRPGLEDVAQVFANEFFAAIDDSYRRMGVGDQGVTRKVRKLAEAFYGRLQAYDAAIKAGDVVGLRTALDRNLYAHGARSDDALDAMVHYALMCVGRLNGTPRSDWIRGAISFPEFQR